MNMFLHNIGEIDGAATVSPNDSLVADTGERFDYVLANPPFGKKSSMTFTNEEGKQEKDDLTYNRQDFWASTSNKQLNFVQHIRTMLKTTGRAAVVVPDNVLFEGGAGETIRKKLLENTDLHTILRLPTGVFYAQGVKANVIFFDNREASPDPWTKEVWYYDYRTNIHHTLKKKPMRYENLSEFIECYNPRNRHRRKATWDERDAPEGRWRSYGYEELTARDKTSLDVFWLKDKSLVDLDNLPEPDELAEQIIKNLEAGLDSFREVLAGATVVVAVRELPNRAPLRRVTSLAILFPSAANLAIAPENAMPPRMPRSVQSGIRRCAASRSTYAGVNPMHDAAYKLQFSHRAHGRGPAARVPAGRGVARLRLRHPGTAAGVACRTGAGAARGGPDVAAARPGGAERRLGVRAGTAGVSVRR